MGDITRALELYSLMAKRYEKSGYAPRQAQVYNEMVEFMKDCASAEEAAMKIRNSKYFLAPSVALMQDKLTVLEQAARENGMPELAKLYQEKIEEIEENTETMYDTTYVTKAQNLKVQYMQTYEAFIDVYNFYLTLSCTNVIDDVVVRDGIKDMKIALSQLIKPSSNFNELANLPRFRALIPVNDESYACFVNFIAKFNEQAVDFTEEKEEIQAEYDKTLALLANYENTIKAAGKTNLAKIKRSLVLAVAPQAKLGCYRYIDEEVTEF